jgi:hypothetical protein
VTLVQQPTTDSDWEPSPFDLEPTPEVQQGDRDQARVLTRIAAATADRLMGLTWQQVADRNGYASKGAVCSAVLGFLRRQANENAAALRDLESARYDRAAAALYAKVLSGDARAQDTWLRNRAAYRALNGLNAPLQVTLSSGAQAALADALGDAEQLVMGLVTARSDEPIPLGPEPAPAGWMAGVAADLAAETEGQRRGNTAMLLWGVHQ